MCILGSLIDSENSRAIIAWLISFDSLTVGENVYPGASKFQSRCRQRDGQQCLSFHQWGSKLIFFFISFFLSFSSSLSFFLSSILSFSLSFFCSSSPNHSQNGLVADTDTSSAKNWLVQIHLVASPLFLNVDALSDFASLLGFNVWSPRIAVMSSSKCCLKVIGPRI